MCKMDQNENFGTLEVLLVPKDVARMTWIEMIMNKFACLSTFVFAETDFFHTL